MNTVNEVDLLDEGTGTLHRGITFRILPGWAWDTKENHWVRVDECLTQKEGCCG